MIRVVFIIRSLEAGGAERQLVQLATNLDKSRFDVSVVTYYTGGQFADELTQIRGVRLFSANKRGRYDTLMFLFRLFRIIRGLRPHIVHGYMWGANELASLLGIFTNAKVVWGIRASNIEFGHYDAAFSLLGRTGAWFSSSADLIIANSKAGRAHHLALGYQSSSIRVIPNGIDIDRFLPVPAARARIRGEWGLLVDAIAVGIVGRLDPMKDHETFFKAAKLVAEALPAARFIVVGGGNDNFRAGLQRLVSELGLSNHVVWAGARRDMPEVYSALDVAISASAFGEGFSNAIGEAMACGVPCVATDVGDAADIMGDCGRLVPPRDADRLAAAIVATIGSDRPVIGRRSRERIAANFSGGALADRTGAALAALMTS